MQSPAVIDFDRLTAPISAEAPAGVDLRVADQATYYGIREARTNARRIEMALDRGEQPDPKNPLDWGKVLQPCLKALTEKTKDLELAAYVIEALLRLHGPAGLRDGFRLTRKLVEKFWDHLYPALEVEDTGDPEPRKSAENRVAMLAGLNGDAEHDGALAPPIRAILIARSPRLGDFRFAQYVNAVHYKRQDELDTIQHAAAETDAAFYRTHHADLAACVEQFERLTIALDQRCGSDSPPSSALRELLESCCDCVRKLAGDKLTAPAAEQPRAAPAEQTAVAAAGAINVGVDVLRTREDAFHTLKKVADYFRRTEPHSVLSYALDQVVRWGRMPLPELLTELISNEDSRSALFKQVGIRPPEGKPEAERLDQ